MDYIIIGLFIDNTSDVFFFLGISFSSGQKFEVYTSYLVFVQHLGVSFDKDTISLHCMQASNV